MRSHGNYLKQAQLLTLYYATRGLFHHHLTSWLVLWDNRHKESPEGFCRRRESVAWHKRTNYIFTPKRHFGSLIYVADRGGQVGTLSPQGSNEYVRVLLVNRKQNVTLLFSSNQAAWDPCNTFDRKYYKNKPGSWCRIVQNIT